MYLLICELRFQRRFVYSHACTLTHVDISHFRRNQNWKRSIIFRCRKPALDLTQMVRFLFVFRSKIPWVVGNFLKLFFWILLITCYIVKGIGGVLGQNLAFYRLLKFGISASIAFLQNLDTCFYRKVMLIQSKSGFRNMGKS